MNSNFINCPECGSKISVEKVFAHQVEDSIRKDYENKLKNQKSKYNKKELALKEREKSLMENEEKIQKEIQDQVAKESQKIESSLRTKIESEISIEMKAKNDELEEKRLELTKAKKRELMLLKKEQDLKSEKDAIELEAARKIAEERELLIANAKKQFLEEHELKDLEKNNIIEEQKRQLNQMKIKLEQGSMQLQGEVQEVSLERSLKTSFPIDDIKAIKPGTEGADVIQTIINSSLQPAGKILWESKNTKTWSGDWIQKLRDDQIDISADIAVLVTKTMPKNIDDFGQIDGVWIIKRNLVLPVACLLRSGLMQITLTRNSANGLEERMQVLHQFLTGSEFKQRMEAIIQTFIGMQNELESEKRSFKRIWSRRQKSIERVLDNTSELWGEFQSLLGEKLGTIETLELENEINENLLNESNNETV